MCERGSKLTFIVLDFKVVKFETGKVTLTGPRTGDTYVVCLDDVEIKILPTLTFIAMNIGCAIKDLDLQTRATSINLLSIN